MATGMIARRGKIVVKCSPYPSVDRVKLGSMWAEVGHTAYATIPGMKRRCIVRITEIRLEHEDGPIREITVSIYTKLNGDRHTKAGTTRVLTAEHLEPMRQKTERDQFGKVVES